MANINVITSSELEAIRAKVAVPESTNKAKTLETLHEMSKKRTESWPNTLLAQRERKEKAKLERLAANEATRQKQDKIEAEAQAVRRRAVIEKVNKMLFNETDRAKGFHSAVLMSDVLAERTAQLELKDRIASVRAAQEEAFVRQQAAQVEAAACAEADKEAKRKEAVMRQRDSQLQQLEALKQSILAEREQNRREGEMLRQKAAQEAEDMRQKASAAKAQAQRANMETTLANDALREFKKKEAERDREADRAIEAYAVRKEALAEERKRREAERAAAKEKKRQEMVQLMETKFAEFMTNENERTERDVKLADEKNATELAERDRRRQEEWAAICNSRTLQLDMRRTKAQQEKLNDLQFAEACKERTKQLRQEEAEEGARRRQVAQQTAGFQKRQVSLKEQKKERERVQALQEAAMLAELATDAEDRFQAYAAEYIDEYSKQGKPVKPMQLYLSKKEPFVSAE